MRMLGRYRTREEALRTCEVLLEVGIEGRVAEDSGEDFRVMVDERWLSEARKALGMPDPVMRVVKPKGKVPWWFSLVVAAAAVTILVKASRVTPEVKDRGWVEDRNGDGRADQRAEWDARGVMKVFWQDDDFNGRWDRRFEYQSGVIAAEDRDLDGDGEWDERVTYRNGVPESSVVRRGGKGPILRAVTYHRGRVAEVLEDPEGDGVWNFRRSYDEMGCEASEQALEGTAKGP